MSDFEPGVLLELLIGELLILGDGLTTDANATGLNNAKATVQFGRSLLDEA